MKKLIVFVLCAAMVFAMAGCKKSEENIETPDAAAETIPAADEEKKEDTQTVDQVNPFTECETMEDAEKIAGISVTLPESAPAGADAPVIRASETLKMVEVVYNGEEDELRIRKAVGTQDISGEFDSFEIVEEVLVGDIAVTLRGNGEIRNLATWTIDGNSYSVSSKAGMEKDALVKLMASVK